MNLDVFLGPAGLATACLVAIGILWREHVKDDDLKDETIKALTASVGAFPNALRDLTGIVLASTERERARPRTERAGDR